MIRLSHSAGQTLIEVVVAVGLVVLVLTTLASGVAIGIRNNRIARDSASAKEYVRENLEWLRNIRDTAGWDTFVTISKTGAGYCLATLPATPALFNGLSTTAGACPTPIAGTPFYRKMTLSKVGTTSVTAVVDITWTDGARSLKSSSTLTLYEWK